MSILLVDDDLDILKALSRFLVGREFSIHTATNGQEALDQIEARPPEVVVSDIRMGGIDGIELLQTVRLRFPGIPIILMTGHGDSSAISALQYGAFDYLKKPIKLQQLLACIERARGRRQLEDQLLQRSRSLLWPKKSIGDAELSREFLDELRKMASAMSGDIQKIESLWQAQLKNSIEEVSGPVITGRQQNATAEVADLMSSMKDKIERLNAVVGAVEKAKAGEGKLTMSAEVLKIKEQRRIVK